MLVIVPSRGRPHNIAELLQAFGATRSYANLRVVVDDDDPLLNEYLALDLPSYAELTVGPRMRLGPTLNAHAVQCTSIYDIISFMGDDHRPRTWHWDQRLAAAIVQTGGVGISYGNDGIQGANLPTAVWMSSCIVETLGYMVPPGMVHLYLDDFWKALGLRIQRLTYVHDVSIEHMHPVAGKAPWDERYAEVNSGEMYENDGRVFQAYLAHALQADAEKIINRCVIK